MSWEGQIAAWAWSARRYGDRVPTVRRENRGPSAAEANRRALLAAAHEVFGERGIDAPLSAVAKRAGVGQGSLYRHFPDRAGLALAVFEDNVLGLEALAQEPGVTLEMLVRALTDQIVGSVAFVDILTATSEDPRVVALADRVKRVLADVAADGRSTVTADDLLLAVGMVAAVVARAPAEQRRAVADRAWVLLWRGLEPAADTH